MARPLKQASEKRSNIAKVRLTSAEKKQMKAAAEIEGVTVSDLLRLRTLSTLPLRRKPSPERAALIRGLGELGKLGSNINQIAHQLNLDAKRTGDAPTGDKIIQEALGQIETLSNHLVNLLGHGD